MHPVHRRDGTSTMAQTPDTSRTRVTAAILEQDGTILLVRRASGRVLGDTWEFPGGKIEPGETPEGCLARELGEELGIVVEVGHLVATNVHKYDWGEMELLAYRVRLVAGELVLRDHDELAWVTPVDLLHYHLAPADVPTARHLLHQ